MTVTMLMMPPPAVRTRFARLAVRGQIDPRLLVLLRPDRRRPGVPRLRPVDDARKQARGHRDRHHPHRAHLSRDRDARRRARSIRRKAIIAGGGVGRRLARDGRDPDPDRGLVPREHGGVPLPGARRLHGRSRRADRSGSSAPPQEPLVLTMPKMRELDPMKRVRYALDAAVVWLFFFLALERLLPRQPGAGRGARRAAAAGRRRKRGAGGAGPGAALPGQSALPVQHAELAVVAGDDRPHRPRRDDAAGALDLLPHQPVARSRARTSRLAEEIELQRLYLDIEKARFPDRLHVEIDVPDELRAGAAAGADPPADRRECDQIWRVEEPQGRRHPDRGAADSTTAAWRSRSATA